VNAGHNARCRPPLARERTARVRKLRRWLGCCLIVAGVCLASGAWAQTPKAKNEAVGSLQATGEVYVNDMRAADGQTIYAGDVVRTGPDGAAALTIPGRGTVTVAADTEVSFRASVYLGELKKGTVAIHSFQATRDFDIDTPNFLAYAPFSAADVAGTITVGEGGTGRVECRIGSIGVSSGKDSGALFLNAGQSVGIDAKGQLGAIESAAPAQSGQTPAQPSNQPVPAVKKSRAGYYVLGAAGAGGAIAAALAALAKGGNGQPVSPSKP
jgi:ferric-dicitrate binding protein FerR (iron transport regulator)